MRGNPKEDMFKKEQLDHWDKSHSWHPFSQMQEYCEWPQLHIARGQGCWLWDTEGKRYLDTNASVWTNTFGHNDPDLNAALKEQLEKVAHCTYLGLSHPKAAELAQTLTAAAPCGLERCFFSDNGSNAIEIALKLSYQYWQLCGKSEKQRIIGMEGGYHGDTIGTMAAGKSGRFHERFKDWFLDSWHFPAPCCQAAHDGCSLGDCAGPHQCNGQTSADHSLQTLEQYLKENAAEVAALVIEPFVQGAAGMHIQPAGFLKSIEQLCRAYDVHLILDEVFVAFGRLGEIYACQKEAVKPDFLCLAKGLGGGYLPIAATLIQSSIYEACLGEWKTDRTFFHGHTFTANPLACAVALKNFQKLQARIQSGKLEQTIRYFGEKIQSHFSRHPNVHGLRQTGLTASIELGPRPGEPDWKIEDRTGWQICLAARHNELLLRPLGDSLLIVPPLIISYQEIDFLCERLLHTLQSVLGSHA